jgi:hypothetical protein
MSLIDHALGADAESSPGGGEDFLSTLLDIINPLQHIPLVSNLYREITGDQISSSARILGGGPIGLTSAATNAIFEQASGDDILGHTLAMFSDDSQPGLAALQASTVSLTAQATPISLNAPAANQTGSGPS